jgi:glycerol-3-phosphate acyltransferase PlsY
MNFTFSTPAFWAGVAACYLVGAIPFSFIIGKLHGVDIRKVGSGNIGATNLGRALGKKWGYAALGLDITKGLFAAAILPWLMLSWGLIDHRIPFNAFAGAAAILGHIYPVYLLFRGGKGVATTVGVFGALLGYWLAIPLAIYWLVARFSDYVSLGSISFAVALPVMAWIRYGGSADNYWVSAIALVAAAFVIWRHRGNIKRLWQGTEPRRSAIKETGQATGSHTDG